MSRDIFKYSPWVNGKAESRMKLITRGCAINNYYRELIGIQDIYNELDDISLKQKNYRDLLPAIMLCHNSKIQPGTKYTPNQLRMSNNITNLLDINLKIAGLRKLNKDEYIKDNIIDYQRFYKLLKEQQCQIIKYAQKNNFNYTLKKKYKNDEQSLENENIYKNDYVILKKNYKDKKHINYQYGWVVIEASRNHDKWKYKLKNIFNHKELTVNKGSIKKFHKPLLSNPIETLENETSRLIDLNHKDKREKILSS